MLPLPPNMMVLIFYLMGAVGCWALFSRILQSPGEAAVFAVLWPVAFPLVGVIVALGHVADYVSNLLAGG
jgi:hypothetical protein